MYQESLNPPAPDRLAQKSYWLRNFKGELPKNALIPDKRPSKAEARPAEFCFRSDAATARHCWKFVTGSPLSAHILFLGVLAVVLRKHTREQEFLLACPVYRPEGPPQYTPAVPLKIALQNDLIFRDLLVEIRSQLLQAYNNCDVPVAEVLSHTDFPFMDDAPVYPIIVEVEGLHRPCRFEQFHSDLILRLSFSREAIEGTAVYRADIYDESSIQSLVEHWINALTAAVVSDGLCVAEIEMAGADELARMISGFNCTERPFKLDRKFIEEFEARVKAAPEQVAVVHGSRQASYVTMLAQANEFATALRDLGVGPGNFAVILGPRTIQFLAAILGTMKAKVTFLLLDSRLPPERIKYFLQDCQPAALFTTQTIGDQLGDFITELSDLRGVIRIDEAANNRGRELIVSKASPRVVRKTIPDDWAYLVYTSGSSGPPKATAIRQDGLMNHILAQREALGLSQSVRILQSAPPSSDIIIWQLLAPLALGGRTVILDHESVVDPAQLFAALKFHQVTLAELVPASLQSLQEYVAELEPAERCLPSLDCMMVTGEAVNVEVVNRWFGLFPDVKLVNCYGPAEASDDVCQYVVQSPLDPDRVRVPIGSPLANVKLYVLDESNRAVPLCSPGEICVGGVAVGAGYCNDAARTERSFVPDPFAENGSARLYRTGDLGRWRPDGTLEYLGRLDEQIKVRGHRLEPAEIEAILCANRLIRQAAVCQQHTEAGLKELVAYLATGDLQADSAATGECQQDQLMQWQSVFEETYARGTRHPDPAFNIIGWNSSYTGLPIPSAEMAEWVQGTVARISALRPQRVLEIGCGTGLLMLRLAEGCRDYVGTDFSTRALNYVRAQFERRGVEAGRVTLLRRMADDFSNFEDGYFDTAILNSLVQYFPNREYLVRVLEGVIGRVAPGGTVFIGDVRSLPLLESYHASVELERAPAQLRKDDFISLVKCRVEQEEELVIDPALFILVAAHHPQVSAVSIWPRRGKAWNELTKFRYDVVVRIGPPRATAPPLELPRSELPINRQISHMIESADSRAVKLAGLPNARLARERRLLALLKEEDGPQTVGQLRHALKLATDTEAVDPEEVWAFQSGQDGQLEVSWEGGGAEGSFDVIYRPPDQEARPVSKSARPIVSYAGLTNDPLQGKFFQRALPRLRQWLGDRLPDYMIPTHFVRLEALPLTPGGKVDRRALQQFRPASSHASQPYLPPRTALEAVVADLWRELLGVSRVGMADNFFDLGGHSLLAAQLVSRIRKLFQTEMPLVKVFESPTVEGLAGVLSALSSPPDRLEKISRIFLEVKRTRPAKAGNSQENNHV